MGAMWTSKTGPPEAAEEIFAPSRPARGPLSQIEIPRQNRGAPRDEKNDDDDDENDEEEGAHRPPKEQVVRWH